MKTQCKRVETINEFIDAIRLRVEVFIREQECEPGWEPDEDDKISEQFIVSVGGKIVSTARVRETDPKVFRIERMVTQKDFRGKGIGRVLVKYIISKIHKNKHERIWVSSQVRSQVFYENCGFIPVSEPFDMYGILHVDMDYKG